MKIDGFKMDQDSRRAETQYIYIYIYLHKIDMVSE